MEREVWASSRDSRTDSVRAKSSWNLSRSYNQHPKDKGREAPGERVTEVLFHRKNRGFTEGLSKTRLRHRNRAREGTRDQVTNPRIPAEVTIAHSKCAGSSLKQSFKEMHGVHLPPLESGSGEKSGPLAFISETWLLKSREVSAPAEWQRRPRMLNRIILHDNSVCQYPLLTYVDNVY